MILLPSHHQKPRRVLRPGGRYYAATSARANDPEIVPRGLPPIELRRRGERSPSSAPVFDHPAEQRWDEAFFALESRDEVRAYCRHASIPAERADAAQLPLWLTKRGCLVRATA